MADRTLYDILGVSRTASPSMLKDAYDRLTKKLDADCLENHGDERARLELAAVKDAFLTLGNPAKRASYDARLDAQAVPPPAFWTLYKAALVAVLVLGGTGYYYKYQAEQSRIAADKQVAIAKAKEAEQKAAAEAEAERARQAYLRAQSAAADERLQRERDVALQRFTAEQSSHQREAQMQENRDRLMKRNTEMQQRREEQQAAMASQQQVARDKALLCQMERQRYGKAISCPY